MTNKPTDLREEFETIGGCTVYPVNGQGIIISCKGGSIGIDEDAWKWVKANYLPKSEAVSKSEVEKIMKNWECVVDVDNPVSILDIKKDLLKEK